VQGYLPSVEALARAMCTALELDPDKQFSHGWGWEGRPRIVRAKDEGDSIPDVLLYSPNWMRFAWQAHKWIFEQSGGELPPPEGKS
jgi:hypothetical protein